MDRRLIAAGESWELSYLMKKFRVSERVVRNAITIVGNNREQVENYIRKQQMKPAVSIN